MDLFDIAGIDGDLEVQRYVRQMEALQVSLRSNFFISYFKKMGYQGSGLKGEGLLQTAQSDPYEEARQKFSQSTGFAHDATG